MVTYVREHPTRVFLPQPQQLDLEITDSSLTTMLHVTPVCFKLLRNTDPPPLQAACLDMQRVNSRCCLSWICEFEYFYTF